MRRVACVILACALALAGCASDPASGYSFRSTYPKSVRTVAVPVFDNQTFQKGLEVELTDAIIKEIQRQTPMVVVQGGGAQSTLTGVIRTADLRALTISGRTGLTQEMGLQVSIDFDWRDASSGQYLASTKNLQALEPFVATRTTGQRLETGTSQVAQELARRVVAQMRGSW